ncbi:DUF2079 domain-containing protein [Arcanobacterium canis]
MSTRQRRRRLPRWIPAMFRKDFPLLLSLAVFLSLSVISVWQWRNFISPSWDLGIFTQLMEQYSHFSEPIVDIKAPGFNLWGDHFHPILLILTPFYWLAPSGLTLLIAQNFLFALSVIPIAWYVPRLIRYAGYPRWIGHALPVSYALSWGIWNAAWSQFHEIAFAVPLLAFGLVAYLRGRLVQAAILIGGLVFVKEDLPLTVIAFAVLAGLRCWLSSRMAKELKLWSVLGVWGAVWFVLEIVFFLPAFNTHGQWDYAAKVSRPFLEIATGFFVPGIKLVTLVLLVTFGAVVCLRSPLIILTLPTLLWRFAGDTVTYWGWQWHYSATLMPIVILAAADGVAKLRLSSLPTASRRRWISVGIVVSLAATTFVTWTGAPTLIATRSYIRVPKDSTAAIAAIPPGARIASDTRHMAYLVPGNTVYFDQTIGDVVPDYWIVSDKSPDVVRSEAQKRWPGTAWDVRSFSSVTLAIRQ